MNSKFIGIATSLIIVVAVLVFLFPDSNVDTNQNDQPDLSRVLTGSASAFSGTVLSAAGALIVGGEETQDGHPVVDATVYLVPTAAIDTTTRMTASDIYLAPFPAEAYDEPLEDSIRLQGTEFPQGRTDSQGNFTVDNVPAGNFFVHVTPATDDSEHLPGGDKSRAAYSTQQLVGEAMTIELSSSPSTAANRRASPPLDDVQTSPARRFLPGDREKTIICITPL